MDLLYLLLVLSTVIILILFYSIFIFNILKKVSDENFKQLVDTTIQVMLLTGVSYTILGVVTALLK